MCVRGWLWFLSLPTGAASVVVALLSGALIIAF
jgi:hypothetical protein